MLSTKTTRIVLFMICSMLLFFCSGIKNHSIETPGQNNYSSPTNQRTCADGSCENKSPFSVVRLTHGQEVGRKSSNHVGDYFVKDCHETSTKEEVTSVNKPCKDGWGYFKCSQSLGRNFSFETSVESFTLKIRILSTGPLLQFLLLTMCMTEI